MAGRPRGSPLAFAVAATSSASGSGTATRPRPSGPIGSTPTTTPTPPAGRGAGHDGAAARRGLDPGHLHAARMPRTGRCWCATGRSTGPTATRCWCPSRPSPGQTVLVDRGWVPTRRAPRRLPRSSPAPTGEVTVTGWVRRGEPSLGATCPAASWRASTSRRRAASGQPAARRLRPARGRAAPRRHGPGSADRAGTAGHRPRAAPGLRVPVVAGAWWPGSSWSGSAPDASTSTAAGRVRAAQKVRIWDEEDG